MGMRINLNQSEIDKLLRSPGGAVHRAVSKYTRQVTAAAKGEANVDTGKMRASTHGYVEVRGTQVVGTIATPVPYAMYVHQGRGPVRAKSAQALRFKPKGSSKYIYRVRVGPYEGNPFLVNALQDAQPWPVTVHS